MTVTLARSPWEMRALGELEARLALAQAAGGPKHPLQTALFGPLAEFLARPAKSVRASLVRSGWRLGGGQGDPPADVLALVELLHAGSLVIDDIQDGSATRRGQPSLHRMHGLPLAINAGTYLLFVAVSLCDSPDLAPATRDALRRLTLDTLLHSHEGQAIDLSMRVTALSQAEIPAVVAATTAGKTGALMGLAAGAGALAAKAPHPVVTAITDFGRQYGNALQMLDDLGGLVQPARAHKGHEDLWGERPTWPWSWLAETVTPAAFAALQQDLAAVVRREQAPETLAAAMRTALGDRMATVRAGLHEAHADLERALGASPALDDLRHMTRQMEQDYV